ncbi:MULTISPECIES: restriction endonuclease subunit S [unclassified Streptomyces]|uniref:restriction endonuclease subunit S n=1 Tax=unclassified Streptomyces TaxID=2593676 RepID=UPI00343722E8
MRNEHWEEVQLGSLLAGPIRNGFSPLESQEWTGVQMLGLGCLTAEGFQPRQLKNAPSSVSVSHSAVLRDGDLLVSRANTRDLVGLAGIYRDTGTPCIYPDLMMRLHLSDDCVPEYIEAVLRSPAVRRRIMAGAQGTSESMVKISAGAIRSLPIPLPPLPEQQRIITKLDAVSAVGDSHQESISKIRSIRQGIMLNAMASVAEATSSIGWTRASLKEVVPSVEYGISEALVNTPNAVPVLRMNNIRDGQADVSDLRYCPVSVSERMFLRRGDVLFNRTNSIEHIGKAALWADELPKATFASYLVRLNPDKNRLRPEYLVEWLHHPLIRQRVKAISTVAVQQVNVNPSRLRELEIDLPVSLEEQDRIVQTLAACDKRIRHEEGELDKLRQLKLGLTDNLLARSPSGR